MKRVARFTALVIAAAAGLAGCSTWNPLVAMGIQSEPAHKPTPLVAFDARMTPRIVWTASVGKSGGFALRPDIEGGKVYVATADGVITIFDEDTGKVVTRTETQKPISGGVEMAENRILVGSQKGEVVALDPNGKQAWVSSVAGEIIAPPSVSRKVAVVRTSDGRIFGLSTEDGKRLWVFQRPSPSLLLRSEAGAIAMGGDVLAGYPNGKLIALDIDDGKLTWEVTVSLPKGATELERIADVAGLPVLDGGNVCAAAFQGKVACFEIQTRNLIWSRDVSTAHNLARDTRYIFVVDDAGAVHALDKSSGASVWKQDGLKYRKVTAPLVVGGVVVVADGFGFVHVLSADDGAFIGRLATDGSPINVVVPATGGVAFQTAKGSVSLVRF